MRKEITVKTTSVYDARHLAEFVGLANNYVSTIVLSMGNYQVNAKSIMGIMGFGLDVDKKITIEAVGEDAKEAIEAMEQFLTK